MQAWPFSWNHSTESEVHGIFYEAEPNVKKYTIYLIYFLFILIIFI